MEEIIILFGIIASAVLFNGLVMFIDRCEYLRKLKKKNTRLKEEINRLKNRQWSYKLFAEIDANSKYCDLLRENHLLKEKLYDSSEIITNYFLR